MPVLSYLHQLFTVDTCHAYIHTLRWKIAHASVPVARARMSIRGGITTTDLGANVTGATAASAPSMTSPRPCSTLKPYLRGFRGLSKCNVPGYLGFFQFLRNFRHKNAFEQAELICRRPRASHGEQSQVG